MTFVNKGIIINIIQEYIDKGERCMEQSGEQKDDKTYTFWDGFHNCAENILEEIKNIK